MNRRRPYRPVTIPEREPIRRRLKDVEEWERDEGGSVYDDWRMEPDLWDPDIGDR